MSDKPSGLNLMRVEFPPHQISKLPKPTCSNEEWKRLPKAPCKECGGYHATSRTIHLSYVGHAALTDRLLDADPHWNWEPLAFTDEGLPRYDETGGLWIKLTVCGVTRLGYGNAERKQHMEVGAREKEVIGDALRNAAMRFGAALELWHKGTLHAEEEQEQPAEQEPNDPRRAEIIADMEAAYKRGGIDDMRFVWQALPKEDRALVGKAEIDRIKGSDTPENG